MTLSCSHCGEPFASTFSPEALAAYLAASGWEEITPNPSPFDLKWRVFEQWFFCARLPTRCELEIPMMTGAVDYDRRVMEVLVNLRRVEQRPISLIARTIQIIEEGP